MWHGVPFACQRRPIVGVLRMCWLLPGSFDCFCCPHTSVHRPSIACLVVFLCGPGALFLHALSGPSPICPPCVTCCRLLLLYGALDSHPFFPPRAASGSVGRCSRCCYWCRFRVRGAPSLVYRGCDPPPRHILTPTSSSVESNGPEECCESPGTQGTGQRRTGGRQSTAGAERDARRRAPRCLAPHTADGGTCALPLPCGHSACGAVGRGGRIWTRDTSIGQQGPAFVTGVPRDIPSRVLFRWARVSEGLQSASVGAQYGPGAPGRVRSDAARPGRALQGVGRPGRQGVAKRVGTIWVYRGENPSLTHNFNYTFSSISKQAESTQICSRPFCAPCRARARVAKISSGQSAAKGHPPPPPNPGSAGQ